MGEHVIGKWAALGRADRDSDQAQLAAYIEQANRSYNGGTSLFEALRTFRGSALDLPRLVELAAYGRALLGEYEALVVPAPIWLKDKLKLVREAVVQANRHEKQSALLIAMRELEELKSREEKRAEKEEEVRRLREELG